MKLSKFFSQKKLSKSGASTEPPFFVLIDTNFIYFSLKNKLDIFESFLNCLYAKVIICASNCVLLELEKLGPKFRLALKILRDERIIKLSCIHTKRIIYADNCILDTINRNPNFIVATCDKNLGKKIKKTSNSTLISIKKKKYILI
ncbi:pre-rRNA processing protein, FCF1 (nucleomorph) [Chroomonas mesostigmatica CCMP1168]|uniref:Pre-rRNA processing protein, FCF1 n=1 Tax=Chroomonas mesostigmatica CCMP1168 TaxID=1195612 RepID=J7G330_9CRYP|nr:pre-rRNA processing protein, FCF1 [Chroomonas mesostigmatica CCMP1168]|mmetsp:Transcript_289/g.782  ORF Transcript_289/g.782 Transcript_289/m.782 type:complete len:146 (-) Transcript_289:2980-3417(-)